MARVALLCLVAVLVAAATSSAAGLSCGTTLTDVPMSGCVACTELNITGLGRARKSGPGGFGRNLLRRGGPRGPDELFTGSMLVPSCTECDTGGNFVLMKRNETSPGRCGCAAGFGTVFTSNATIVVGNITKVIPQFACVQCAAGEVPLGPDSNLRPSFSNGTWTLVLINSATITKTVTGAPVDGVAVASRRAGGQGGKPGGPGGKFSPNRPAPRPDGGNSDRFGGLDGPRFDHGDWGFDGRGFKGTGRPPNAPGQCVACPEGSTTADGISCVAQ